MLGENAIGLWIKAQIRRDPPRTKSLIITLFGDSIEPHGGTLWIGSLIRLLAPFGILERNARTSVYRLVQDQWLEATGEAGGKRSFYRMTTAGRLRAAHAHRRIYDDIAQTWAGDWTLLLLEHGASTVLRHDLDWQGFGRFSPQLYAHPAPDARALQEILEAHGPRERITAFRANAMALTGLETARHLVGRGWPLEEVARHYDAFVQTFAKPKWLREQNDAEAEQDFVLRTLLIHEFRRAQLRDPRLPAALLPDRWPGAAGRELCKSLYEKCTIGAERHLVETAESPDGALRPAAPYFFERFGGMASNPT